MSKLVPKYTMWEAMNAALLGVQRALEEIRALARTPGPQGKPGKDGVGFDDLELVETDEGVFLRCTRGENFKQWRLPIVRDAGVFREATTYRKGDGVSYAGSWFICQDQQTTDKPETSKAWRLAVKRGRDGRDGTLKDPPKSGPVKV